MTTTSLAIRIQSWAETLRLPCFMNADEVAPLHTAVDPLRRPPVPLQSKHLPALKRGQWYALRRPVERVRQGLLCIWNQTCVYVSGDAPTTKFPTPRTALLRLRVDPQFTVKPGVGLTVFAATLCPTARRLWVEDVLMWKGRDVFAEERFRARWCLAAQWLEHYCIVDPALVDGLELVLARWTALDQVKPEGVWMMQSEESGRRPLLWNPGRHDEITVEQTLPSLRITHVTTVGGEVEPPSPAPFAAAPKLDVGPLMAVAVREAGPDQWSLASADGVSLGRALIRTLEVSAALRSSSRPIVEVEWNNGFKKWEVKAVCTEMGATATAAAFFTRD